MKPLPNDIAYHWASAPTDAPERYEACKRIDGLKGDGTFLIMAARVCKYYCLGYRQPFYEPITDIEQLPTIAAVNYALSDSGVATRYYNHVMLEFNCFKSVLTSRDGRLDKPEPGDRKVGRHAVAMSGFDFDTGDVLFQNSWGVQWGDKGYGALTEPFMRRHLNDAWVARDACAGWTREKLDRLNSAATSAQFTREWLARTPIWKRRRRHGLERFEWVYYDTISVRGCPAEIIDLRNGRGLRLGWAHLLHLCGKQDMNTSVLAELFVWPDYRRRGYGSMLEEAALARARHRGSSRFLLPLYEADGVRGVAAPGRKFAERRGYRWRWGSAKLPMTRALAEKSVG